jgi:L-seryl-tRNA(Ser) seleniumtransferase
MTDARHQCLRQLPAVDRLLAEPRAGAWLDQHPRSLVVAALQAALAAARDAILDGTASAAPPLDRLLDHAQAHLDEQAAPSLRRVINATGVVLHTGLGRAPLADTALTAMQACARGYSNLEFNLADGTRGRRGDHVSRLLVELTGAEAATVVNNNAAATLLILNTLARGQEVIVSRGELVEIGGSYRLPDMMAASGALLREVGTTNRTRVEDFARAIGENTAAILRVHTSNYRLVGFTQAPRFDELIALGQEHDLPVIDDLGSGALIDLERYGLPDEPLVRASVDAGADVVCFSGDKLLGGPQAGIIVGRRAWIRRIEANPLMRTYRTGKLTLAALEATLRLYRDPTRAIEEIPTLAMLTSDRAGLEPRAQALAASLRAACPSESFAVIDAVSLAGGGALPARELATRCVTWQPASLSATAALARLREHEPPIIARTQTERIFLDPRTLTDADLPIVTAAVARIAVPQP